MFYILYLTSYASSYSSWIASNLAVTGWGALTTRAVQTSPTSPEKWQTPWAININWSTLEWSSHSNDANTRFSVGEKSKKRRKDSKRSREQNSYRIVVYLHLAQALEAGRVGGPNLGCCLDQTHSTPANQKSKLSIDICYRCCWEQTWTNCVVKNLENPFCLSRGLFGKMLWAKYSTASGRSLPPWHFLGVTTISP